MNLLGFFFNEIQIWSIGLGQVCLVMSYIYCVFFFENLYFDVDLVFEVYGVFDIERFFGLFEWLELFFVVVCVYVFGICLCMQVDQEVFDVVFELFVVVCFCIGMNQVEFEVVVECGVLVFNVLFVNICFVVELMFVSIVMLMCGILCKMQVICGGEWFKFVEGLYEVCGKKFGIVGYGNIGLQFLVFVLGYGMYVYYYDKGFKLVYGNVCLVYLFDELFEFFDVVMLYVLLMLCICGMIDEVVI